MLMRGKHSLVMKFYQLMSYFKRKIASQNSAKNVVWKLVPSPFCLQKT